LVEVSGAAPRGRHRPAARSILRPCRFPGIRRFGGARPGRSGFRSGDRCPIGRRRGRCQPCRGRGGRTSVFSPRRPAPRERDAPPTPSNCWWAHSPSACSPSRRPASRRASVRR
jgi:hypothetical protein